MRDPEIDQSAERPYECFECGIIVTAESQPGACPECGGEMRNRRTPIE